MAVALVASSWLGTWRNQGDGLPSWSGGGLGFLRQRRLLPSKNEISSAKVGHLTRYAEQYGTMTNSVAVDIVAVPASLRTCESAPL